MNELFHSLTFYLHFNTRQKEYLKYTYLHTLTTQQQELNMKTLTRQKFMVKIKEGDGIIEGYDLSGLDLSNINEAYEDYGISNITFKLCKLRETNFENSEMIRCRYEYCDLSYANFKSSINTDSKFKYCCLLNASFHFTNISEGSIINCEMERIHGFEYACKNGMQFIGSAYL